jgi:hypothetical protein
LDAMDPSKQMTAKTLGSTKLSNFLEKQIENVVFEGGESNVTVRVVSNTKEKTPIGEKLAKRYGSIYGNHTELEFTQKQIYAFYQQPDGHDVCFFGIQTQEYGADAPGAHKNIAYLAYIDSCQLFHMPECGAHKDKVGLDTWLEEDPQKHSCCTCEERCRTRRRKLVQVLMHSYMEYLRLRGFKSMWIWVMAPQQDDPTHRMSDYMFNYRPSCQFIPNQAQLERWYVKLLESAKERNIIVEFFDNTGRRAADKKKQREKRDSRSLEFAFTAHHGPPGRSPLPSPSEAGMPVDDDAAADLKRKEAEPAVDDKAAAAPPLRSSKRQRLARGQAASSPAGTPSADDLVDSISVANIPFFKDDHLHYVAEQVLAEDEQDKMKRARPGIALKRTQSHSYAAKVAKKLADRTQV